MQKKANENVAQKPQKKKQKHVIISHQTMEFTISRQNTQVITFALSFLQGHHGGSLSINLARLRMYSFHRESSN